MGDIIGYDAVELARRLIREESVTPSAAGCFDIIEGWLSALGFRVCREVFSEEGFEDTENLYARLGDGAPNICFAGHVDVVPAGDISAWTVPPFAAEIVADGDSAGEKYLYGRGAEDMKAAIAAFIAAVADYISAATADTGSFSGSISLLLTADEEGVAVNGTKKMLRWLADRGEKLDYCIVGEPTNPEYIGQMCKVGRRGSLSCVLTVDGVQGHVAYPERARNPVSCLVDMLHHLQNQKIDDGSEFFQPSNLEVTSIDVGNDVVNLIPARAVARFNIRFNDIYSGDAIKGWVRRQCELIAADRGITYDIDMNVSGESFVTHSRTLIDALIRASETVTGHIPSLSTTGGTSDARFIKDYCPVVEFGTTGLTPHKVDERVRLDDIYLLSAVYREFLSNMLSFS